MEATMAAGFEPATPASFEQSGSIQTRAGFDVFEILPARAKELLRQLRLKACDANALLPEFSDRHSANTARGDAERRSQRLLAPSAQGGFDLRENDPQVIEARRQLEKLADEARRLSELYEARSAAWQSASRVVQAVESYLRDGRPGGTALQEYDGPEPKLLKGETVTDAIERLRRRGRELKADQHRIRSAPFPSSHAKAQVRAQIEALAQQGAPSVSNLIEHDRPISWPTQVLRSAVHAETPSIAFAEVHGVLPVIAWLHRDALIARLDAEIDAEADDAGALTHEERQRQEAEVMGDLLEIERQEAAVVWRAMDERLPVEHRADCSPLAILQCRLITAPAVNGRGTSPMHAFDIVGLRR
jgi:hypothetical protein